MFRLSGGTSIFFIFLLGLDHCILISWLILSLLYLDDLWKTKHEPRVAVWRTLSIEPRAGVGEIRRHSPCSRPRDKKRPLA